ncbi:peptidoglycan/LPS O-acetylase OafA/YrhL [Geodermatophilus normandii]|uniref:Peptidoglycan/LPS O-acetylase OafA/YrhL n=1 Tax=Geodermatophilus normandii TaxID=1137989 RepID=A0A317QCN6_9ACTN|nr:acyltransferase family protein [Geodermatophilus normandii]PWW21112.1 peptidoglycan/LPS O-acetylase OafA/YrhL [Geodermatophilus normandii]
MPGASPRLPAPGAGGRHASGDRRGFRPDVEGLRAVAVLAVVLFHAGVPGLTGGYVGVDVFLVLSGFLITGLLWRELAATGTVRLGRFFGARARRLLPAGITVLLTTAVAAAWLLPPLQARTALGDAVAAAVYGANYALVIRGTDYLAADTAPSPFQHFWSLGVEEQFYLLWPALMIGVGWLAWRGGRRRSVVPPAAVLAALTAASFAVSLAWTSSSPPWAYFSLPSRAWELGLGGLVALGLPLWRRLPAALAVPAGWAGLGMVVAGATLLDEGTPFPGTAALLPVVGTALVVCTGVRPRRGGVGGLLSIGLLRGIGRWSYSWYLWHWPVLVLAPYLVGDLGLGGRLAAAALALLLAGATLHLLENRVRFARSLRDSARRSLLLGGGLTAAGVAGALVVTALVPAPIGEGAAAEAATLEVPAQPPAPVAAAVDPRDALVADLTAQVQAAVAGSAGLAAVPSNLTPPLAEARADVPAVFNNGCFLTWLAVEQPTCEYGVPGAPVSVTLAGDSHAAQWVPALEPVAEQQGWRLRVASKVTCPLLDLPITSPYLDRVYTECGEWREQVVADLRAAPPSLVVLATTRRYGADFGFLPYDPVWLDALGRMVTDLRSTGAAVLVLSPVPDPHAVVPSCLAEHLDDAGACTPDRATGVDEAGVAAEAQVVQAAGGSYADLTDLFCSTAECPLVVGDQLVFRDDNHLTAGYAAFLGPVMGALVARELPAG